MEVPGSWIRTARNYSLENNLLTAELLSKSGHYRSAKILVEGDKIYHNDNARFRAEQKSFSFQTNRYVVFLMTCCRPFNHPEKSRREMYANQIEKWLTTGLDLVVVDSSGETFPEFTNSRLKVVSFKMTSEIIKENNLNQTSSTSFEAYSFLYALNQLEEEEHEPYLTCTHIVKITGRYFLKEMKEALSNLYPDLDVYVQIHQNHRDQFQHTEYFVMRRSMTREFFLTALPARFHLENYLYHLIMKNEISFAKFGPFSNKMPRGGDGIVLKRL